MADSVLLLLELFDDSEVTVKPTQPGPPNVFLVNQKTSSEQRISFFNQHSLITALQLICLLKNPNSFVLNLF